MITVTLYIRNDCHLCEIAQDHLLKLRDKYPHKLVLIDVDTNKDLQRAYGTSVPIIEAGPYRITLPYTPQELEMTLAAAIDRKNQLKEIEGSRYDEMVIKGQTWTKTDGVSYWFAKHYMFLLNLFVALYVGLPFLAPILMNYKIVRPAKFIYQAYSVVCHQLAFRSFFLFGEQVVYPRQIAGLENILSYQEATGFQEDNNPANLLKAEQYIGDLKIGYKVALCQRDIAIYLGILAFGLLYAATGRRLPPLYWAFWIGFGLIPIGLDGLSQLFSQPPFSLIAYRESTPFLRILTGGLFGFTTAWFGYPLVELTMSDARKILATKYLRIKE